MKYKIQFLLMLVCLCLNSKTFAETFSLDQLIELAIKNSILINAQELEVLAKEKMTNQAVVWDNPTIEFGNELKKEASGSTRVSSFGLSQTFYKPGKFSIKENISKGETEVLKQEKIATELSIRWDVFKLLFEYKIAKEKLNWVKERIEKFKNIEFFLQSRVFVAPQKKAEASIVRAKLMVLQKELMSILLRKEQIWSELNSYLKLNSEPEVKFSWYVNGPEVSQMELLNELLNRNIDLKIQDIKMNQAKSENELASLESWPSLTLAGSFSRGTGLNPENVYGVGVSFPMPIFNTNTSGKEASEYKYQAEQVKFNFLKERISRQLQSAYLAYEFSKKSIKALPVKKISEFKKMALEIELGFKKSQVDLLTYLEADTQYFESLSAVLEAQLELVKNISNLQQLVGSRKLLLEN